MVFPSDLWKEIKKAAIDAGLTTTQFVIDSMADKVLAPKKIRKAS